MVLIEYGQTLWVCKLCGRIFHYAVNDPDFKEGICLRCGPITLFDYGKPFQIKYKIKFKLNLYGTLEVLQFTNDVHLARKDIDLQYYGECLEDEKAEFKKLTKEVQFQFETRGYDLQAYFEDQYYFLTHKKVELDKR